MSWKIDRFSRTWRRLRDLRRLEEAGARLAFVIEDIDTSGADGEVRAIARGGLEAVVVARGRGRVAERVRLVVRDDSPGDVGEPPAQDPQGGGVEPGSRR